MISNNHPNDRWYLGDGKIPLCSKACAAEYEAYEYDASMDDGETYRQCSGFTEPTDPEIGDICRICKKIWAPDSKPRLHSPPNLHILPKQIVVLAQERERLLLERQLRASIQVNNLKKQR